MKKVTLVLAVAVSAFLIGCQESSNVNPISNESSSIAKANVRNVSPDGVIELSGIVGLEPAESVDKSYSLSGTAQFSVVQLDDQGDYAFSLVTDARLLSLIDGSTVGKANGESIDQVHLDSKQPTIYEAVYSMNGFEKEIELHLQLSITAEAVQLDGAWIAESSNFDRHNVTK